METNNLEKVQAGSLEIVLNEFVQEQKLHSKTIDDLVAKVNGLTGKFKLFEEKLDNPKEISVTTDTKPILEILKKAITEMQLRVSAQPKSIIKKYQLLLFPEQDARLFYKIVFGRWFMWLAIMLFFTLLYKWSIYHSDNNKQLMMEALKNNKTVKAWNYLYNQNNKGLHKLMDSAWVKSDQVSE